MSLRIAGYSRASSAALSEANCLRNLGDVEFRESNNNRVMGVTQGLGDQMADFTLGSRGAAVSAQTPRHVDQHAG